MFVVQYRKIFFVLSIILMAVSIAAMRGGTISQVSYKGERPLQAEVQEDLTKLGFGNIVLQPTGEKGYVLRTRELTPAEKETVLNVLSRNNTSPLNIEKYDSIGPVVGNELKRKALTAIALVIVCIVLFVSYAFRKVSEPVSSWKFGIATVIALLHDVIIPTGFFIIYIHYFGGEIDVLFVSAILAILGYSVHDTIVVFDRVREHLRLNREERKREHFETTVGKSVSETFGRSINTSLTIFLVLVALYIFGGETTKHFALVLLMGIIIGTYSSIFVASPLLVTLEKLQKRK
ncbi:protein translocase subunit SecF [Candidatus Parcubacteria bacterium]|nr:protein translocase subunit SecF [Candidatus Parcubacteria bacterium]